MHCVSFLHNLCIRCLRLCVCVCVCVCRVFVLRMYKYFAGACPTSCWSSFVSESLVLLHFARGSRGSGPFLLQGQQFSSTSFSFSHSWQLPLLSSQVLTDEGSTKVRVSCIEAATVAIWISLASLASSFFETLTLAPLCFVSFEGYVATVSTWGDWQ